MTRFARAKGSKSCNEKTPGDSTPWEVMKDQLIQSKKETEEAQKRMEAEQQRQENYDNFLKERRTQKRNATWCDFPDAMNDTKRKSESSEVKKNKSKSTEINDTLNKSNDMRSEKKIKTTLNSSSNDANFMNPEVKTIEVNKSKKKKKLKNTVVNNSKCNNLHNVQNDDNLPDSDLSKSDKPEKQNFQKFDNNPKKKKTKFKDGKPERRKAIDNSSFHIIINGKDVDLVRFDGFPIMKKDAERLQDLKDNMIKKGIPKSEVQRTIKLERRRAEKALARLKRDVCYNCRKGGHNLSDCPELKSLIPGDNIADGVCFKCGSTEHRQFECKVLRDAEFRFATCFICKEQGHIARQCPDNPKGLYPNGGSCKLCGDVTHLRKDCPTIKTNKEESSIRLEVFDGSNDLEGVTQKETKPQKQTSKQPKKIKF